MAHNVTPKITYQIRRRTAQVDKVRNQPLTKATPQWLGDNSGNVFTFNGQTLPAGYVVVRDYKGILSVAYNGSGVPTNTPGIAIWVGYEPNLHPTVLQVLSQRDTYSSSPSNPNLPSHHLTHEYPGGDTVNVHSEQFLPALVLGNNGLTLTIYPFFCPKSTGGWVYIPGQTLDMTGSVPASGAQAFAICALDGGTISIVSGSTEATPELITAADFPSMPGATYHALCAVRLYTGQTVINQGGALPDIYDLRWLGGGSGGGGGTPGGSDTYVQVNKTGAFYGDNNFIYLYASRNWILNWAGVTPYNLSNDDFHLAAEGDSPAFAAWIFYSGLSPTATTGARFIATAARGTKASPTALQAGDSIGGLSFKPFDGVLSGGNMSNLRTNAQIVARVLNNQSSTDHSTEIDIYTTPSGTATEVLAVTIKNDGSLDMKTHTVTNVKLDRHNSLL